MTEDGWTHVPKSKNRGKSNKAAQANLPATSRPSIDRSATLESTQKAYETQERLWKRSECRARALQTLNQCTARDHDYSHAILLASGGFSHDHLARRRKSLLQLAAFVDLAKRLQRLRSRRSERFEERLPLFAQDPVYAELDCRFLESLGVAVLGDPEAQAMFCRGSFVFAAFPEWVAGIDSAAFVGRVAVYVGTALCDVAETTRGELDEEVRAAGRVAETRMREYVKKDFPSCEEDEAAFAGLAFYFHQSQDEEAGEEEGGGGEEVTPSVEG